MTELTKFIESTQVRNFIICVIIFNAIILGLETSETVMSNFGGLIQSLDKVCLFIFVVELALKLIAYRFRFFTNWWNIFDTLVSRYRLFRQADHSRFYARCGYSGYCALFQQHHGYGVWSRGLSRPCRVWPRSFC